MTSNETTNYEELYDHIKEEIESATIAIQDTKGFFIIIPFNHFPFLT